MDKERLVKQRADIQIVALTQVRLYEPAYLEDADNVIYAALIHRQAAVGLIFDIREYLLMAARDIHRGQIDSRREHALDRDLAELKRGRDQVALLLVEAALFGHVLDDIVYLILGHRRLAVAWGESCRRLTDLRQKLGKRGKELHKEYKYAGAAFCKALAVLFGDALGEHLTCEKHHYRSDDSAQRNGAEPPYSRDRDGHKRSRGNMYDVGTYQQSADCHVKIVHNIQCSLRAGLTALGGDLYLGARRGGERRLRHGKEHCAEEQRNRDYPGGKFGRRLSRYLRQSTAIIHLGYTTPFVYRINS